MKLNQQLPITHPAAVQAAQKPGAGAGDDVLLFPWDRDSSRRLTAPPGGFIPPVKW